MATTDLSFDSLTNQEYHPDLYRHDQVIVPLPGLRAIASTHLDQYEAMGFLSVADMFTPTEVQDALDALIEMASKPRPPGVELQFESAAKGVIENLSPEERLDYVRKLMWFYQHDARLLAMANHPGLIGLVKRLLGAEPEMFQDMALMKPPGIGREKPWHQDHAYFDLPEGTPVVGVWIALDEATPENGCMVFQPGGHRDGPLPHFSRRDWQICDTDVLPVGGKVAAPLPSGGALIFDGLTPHGTPSNRSSTRRRALQFHYIPKGTPRVTKEERMRIFGSEGRDVSC
ncbi:MAG: phytanoyl-CoA dioxygenase family protein [Fimbriimonas sp.]